jgi:hypothetical protein
MSVATLIAVGGASTAVADPVGSGAGSSFAIKADVLGSNVIPPTPTAATTAPAAAETSNTVVAIPADPLLVNGTLIARSAVHAASDLPSELNQSTQTVTGPYNARAIGQIEDLSVLINAQVPGGKLISADLIRAEAVAVCSANAVKYSANSEVVDLQIGGADPLSGPLNDALKQITDGLAPLADLISVNLNVVTPTATGIGVDAIVVTLLQAAADNGAPGPLVQIRLGHAEVSGVACGGGGAPQCSDNADNDGDGKVDILDPGCHSDNDPNNPNTYVPSDNDERDGTQCSDTRDNDGDGVIDALDPGCHTDGNAGNQASYDPTDNDEANTIVAGVALAKDASAAPLAATGGAVATGMAAALALGALGLFALRRRVA